MNRNAEFNRFKAEAICRLCELESFIDYFSAGMLKRSTENGTSDKEDIADDLRNYSVWLKQNVQGYIDRAVENTIATLGLDK